MRNIKLTIKFIGTNYHGWQIQENGITIQETLTKAVCKVCNDTAIKLIGCGRTDSGVHALKYTVSFKTFSNIAAERLPLALNTLLPIDIVCISAEDVSEAFDASRSSVRKTYTYFIHNSQIADPFLFPYTHSVKGFLDVDKMKAAANYFIGTHDFIGFAATGFSVKTTERTIFNLDVVKKDDIISISVTGDGFLYNMVRIIVGTLIEVGFSRILPEEISGIISSKKRVLAGPTAPAKGLFLTEVYY